jgi:hypothetical protein
MCPWCFLTPACPCRRGGESPSLTLGKALVAVARRLRRLSLRRSRSSHPVEKDPDGLQARRSARRHRARIVDINTGEFTPLKNNPGSEERTHGRFIALTNSEVTTSTFAHAPQGVLPPTRPDGSQNDCDGKGLESLEQCFGGELAPR